MLTASDVLDASMESVRRLRQIDNEIELLRSRVGGQGTGIGPHIDHTTILDVMRSVDECIVAEESLALERESCLECIDDGWVIVFGMDSIMRGEEIDGNVRAAVTHAVALRYLYGLSWENVARYVPFDVATAKSMCSVAIGWIDSRGVAVVKEAASGE